MEKKKGGSLLRPGEERGEGEVSYSGKTEKRNTSPCCRCDGKEKEKAAERCKSDQFKKREPKKRRSSCIDLRDRRQKKNNGEE